MNPALPGGAIGATSSRAEDAWLLGGRLGYVFVPYHRMQQGLRFVDNVGRLQIDVHLVTAQAFAAAPSGTMLDVQLPFGGLVTRSLMGDREDVGVGDLELRVRQSVSRFLHVPWLTLGVTLGAVAPTGPYVARSGAANLTPEASYLTLGRGVGWWIAEVDARFATSPRAAVVTQLSARGPFSAADDGFTWGHEVRAIAGVQVVALRRWLTVLLSTEVLWRGGATEPNPFAPGRLDSANAGGVYWSLSPTAVVDLPRGFQLLGGVRVPLLNDVTGNQLVPYPGVFVAAGYARGVEPRRAAPQRFLPRPGAITVVDYWASWCAPCVEISRALGGARRRWRDVRVVQLDATAWPAGELPRLLGAPGLPVVEIFGRDGSSLVRLVGPDAARAVEVVDSILAGRAAVLPLEGPRPQQEQR